MHHVMGQRIVAAKIKRLNHFLVGHPVKTARMAPKVFDMGGVVLPDEYVCCAMLWGL